MFTRPIKGCLLYSILVSAVFFATTAIVSATETNNPAPIFGAETQQQTLACTSIRCRNRQSRRIFRAECRLDGGRPRGDLCVYTVRPGGVP